MCFKSLGEVEKDIDKSKLSKKVYEGGLKKLLSRWKNIQNEGYYIKEL